MACKNLPGREWNQCQGRVDLGLERKDTDMKTTSTNREQRGRQFILGAAAAAAVVVGMLAAACGGGSSHKAASPANPGAASSSSRSSAVNDASSNSGDADKVKRRFNDELKAITKRDWKKLYGILSPRSRADCKSSDFSDVMTIATKEYDDLKADVANVKVTISGDKAVVSGFGPNGTIALGYVKVDGTWYDDNDGDSACNGMGL